MNFFAVYKASHRGASSSAPSASSAVPYSPLWVSAVPSSGQVVLTWEAVTQLWGGEAISGDPVTLYRVRRGTTAANVDVGGSATATDTTTNLTYTFTGLSSSTQWFSVTAENSAGESAASIPYEVTIP